MRTAFLTDFDIHLLAEGKHFRSYEKMGAHLAEVDGVRGVRYTVWAPNARKVSVIGDFNGWNSTSNPMQSRGDAGLWECFVPDIGHGALYKYHIVSQYNEL